MMRDVSIVSRKVGGCARPQAAVLARETEAPARLRKSGTVLEAVKVPPGSIESDLISRVPASLDGLCARRPRERQPGRRTLSGCAAAEQRTGGRGPAARKW